MPGINFFYTFAAVSPSKRTMILDHGSKCNDQNSPNTILIEDKHYVLKLYRLRGISVSFI